MEKRRHPRNSPPKRRSQRQSFEFKPACWKQLLNLSPWDSAHVGIPGIIHRKVIPHDHAPGTEHSQHFPRDLDLHAIVKNRSKNSGLKNDIERAVRKLQLLGISAY
jgi:hypothetical protein